jgi:hypothetical protein
MFNYLYDVRSKHICSDKHLASYAQEEHEKRK